MPPVAAALDAVGISSVAVKGKVPQEEREQAVARFRRGEVQVLLGSSVLERGLNLQTANLLVSLDCSWAEDRETQREGHLPPDRLAVRARRTPRAAAGHQPGQAQGGSGPAAWAGRPQRPDQPVAALAG